MHECNGTTKATSCHGTEQFETEQQAQAWRVHFGPAAWNARIKIGGQFEPVPEQRNRAGPGPTARLEQRHPKVDPSLLPFVLPQPQHDSVWAKRSPYSECQTYLLQQPSPDPYTVPRTRHVPVLWYHSEQIRRADDAGVDLSQIIAEGPDPAPLDTPLPVDMADLFVERGTWTEICDYYANYCREVERIERGYKLRLRNIPHGADGLHVPGSKIKEQFRRNIWANTGSGPQPVRPTIPDSNTTVNLERVYADAVVDRAPDQEVASMIALYGIQARSSLSGDSYFMPNYKSGWAELETLQQAYSTKRNGHGKFPRATRRRRQPHHIPCRLQPKGCVIQIKAKVSGRTLDLNG
eukprot:SAG31_NODE_8933_length_1361_cov_1.906498_1_plen_351_part_00